MILKILLSSDWLFDKSLAIFYDKLNSLLKYFPLYKMNVNRAESIVEPNHKLRKKLWCKRRHFESFKPRLLAGIKWKLPFLTYWHLKAATYINYLAFT